MTDRLLTPPISFLMWAFFRVDHVKTPLRLKAGVDW